MQNIKLFYVYLILFNSALVSAELNDLKEGKQNLREIVCKNDNNDDISTFWFLCDFAINWVTGPMTELCIGASKILAGTGSCQQGWHYYSELINEDCKNNIKNWVNLLCPPTRANLECCIQKAKYVSTVLPKCEELSVKIIDLGKKVCLLPREEGLWEANVGCSYSIRPLLDNPRKLCYMLFVFPIQQKSIVL